MMTVQVAAGRIAGFLILLFCHLSPRSVAAQPDAPITTEETLPAPAGMEVLEEGPIHESFAETVFLDPNGGVVISQAPPEPIQEVPATERPDDPAALWISGYWGWDLERRDFVWISGVWRIPPPGRTWVPGSWSPVEGGHQWFSGYWTGDGSQVVPTLPLPPNSLEIGPSSPSPGPQFLWTTGFWEWIVQQQTYVWHPGCWREEQENWIWVPSYYCRSPGGVVFVSGYRDFGFADRGCLYAPIHFQRRLYLNPGYTYQPCHALSKRQVRGYPRISGPLRSAGSFPGNRRGGLVTMPRGAVKIPPFVRQIEQFRKPVVGQRLSDIARSAASLKPPMSKGPAAKLSRRVRPTPNFGQRLRVELPKVDRAPKHSVQNSKKLSASPKARFQTAMPPKTFSMPRVSSGQGIGRMNFPSGPSNRARFNGRSGKDGRERTNSRSARKD